MTYGNGNHFKSAMCLPSPQVPQAGWCEYDGLWEHQRGSRLRYCGIVKMPVTPFAYFLSHTFICVSSCQKISKGEGSVYSFIRWGL